MKITKIEAYSLTLPLQTKYFKTTSYGLRKEIYELILKVHTDEGIIGLGEAACAPPTGARTLCTQGMALELVKTCLGPALIGENPFKIRLIHEKMNEGIVGNGSIKGAFDMAMYDIMGKKLGVPIYDLIGGNSYGKTEFQNEVDFPTHFGFAGTAESMAKEAEEFVKKRGYKRWAIKLGVPGESVAKEIQKIRMVCEAIGPDIPLHIDPNTGWSLEKSIKILSGIKGCNISDIHQPVPPWDVEGLAVLNQMFPEFSLVADESAFERYFTEIVRRRAVNAIALKAFYTGGYYPTLQIIGACDNVGIRVYMNGGIETNMLITARTHVTLMLGPGKSAGATGGPISGAVNLKLEQPDLVKGGGNQIIGKRTLKISTEPGLGITELNEHMLKPELSVNVCG